ncbi:MAG: YlbF family regulator [Bacilli bacterium]
MIEKVYKIIDIIEISTLKKSLDEIKIKIKKDPESQNIIKRFNNAKALYEDYNSKKSFTKAKISLMENELIKRYLEIQNEINLLTLQINNRLKKITNNKLCQK